jgi:hypothetical protein
MSGGDSVLGIVIAVLGLIGSVLVARISSPGNRPTQPPLPSGTESSGTSVSELKVSPEIWRRFSVLEEKVDHLTALVEEQKEKVSALERLLRQAMRIIRRANRRLARHQETPEEVPMELIPYSIE